MTYYRPTEFWSQSSFYKTGDHSDHVLYGKIATVAYNNYEVSQYQNIVQLPIKYYVGYPIRSLPINVSSADARHLKPKSSLITPNTIANLFTITAAKTYALMLITSTASTKSPIDLLQRSQLTRRIDKH